MTQNHHICSDFHQIFQTFGLHLMQKHGDIPKPIPSTTTIVVAYFHQPSLGWDLLYVFFFCHIKAASKKGWKVKSHSLLVNWSFVSASFFGLSFQSSIFDGTYLIYRRFSQHPLSSGLSKGHDERWHPAPGACELRDDGLGRFAVTPNGGDLTGGTSDGRDVFFLGAWLMAKNPQKMILEISGCSYTLW